MMRNALIVGFTVGNEIMGLYICCWNI